MTVLAICVAVALSGHLVIAWSAKALPRTRAHAYGLMWLDLDLVNPNLEKAVLTGLSLVTKEVKAHCAEPSAVLLYLTRRLSNASRTRVT